MTLSEDEKQRFWGRYESALEEFKHSRDIEELITELREIVNSKDPNPPIDLLIELSMRFKKL
ncbi:MAG: hypothetical protein ACFFAJ_14585, partial [Candidatus Hodarchaeota archaeon]